MQIFHPHCNATHFNPKVVECPFQHDIVKDTSQIYRRLLYGYTHLKLFLDTNIVVRDFFHMTNTQHFIDMMCT
jgi:hypothetical protein